MGRILAIDPGSALAISGGEVDGVYGGRVLSAHQAYLGRPAWIVLKHEVDSAAESLLNVAISNGVASDPLPALKGGGSAGVWGVTPLYGSYWKNLQSTSIKFPAYPP